MYKINRQMSILEFMSPFGKLDPENRWVKIAEMIPWEKYEPEYAKQFCDDNGAPATPFRMALGTLIIKQRTGNSDEETLRDIQETPYMQYLIGLEEYTTEPPFCSSSITNFRKYIPQEMINRINDEVFNPSKQKTKDKNDDDDNTNVNDSENNESGSRSISPNKGELLLDATCAPASITYPTDVNLLNEAREKLEGIIDTLHKHNRSPKKPRTYRQKARKNYLSFAKNRKPSKNAVRKAVGQQLRYVRRNLGYIEEQLETGSIDVLSTRQQAHLETIRTLYAQQEEMYNKRTHSVENRIVSITQPWVRPIVRGKARSDVEFGAKVSISMINGYAFVDRIGWEAYSEAGLLKSCVEAYRKKHGFYPEAVIVDKLYRNRDNRNYCKERGIRISGPRLGRPSKQDISDSKKHKQQERSDASTRNHVEGKIGETKTCYGLDRVAAKLQSASETVISMAFLCANIARRLRFPLLIIWMILAICFLQVDFFFRKRYQKICWGF